MKKEVLLKKIDPIRDPYAEKNRALLLPSITEQDKAQVTLNKESDAWKIKIYKNKLNKWCRHKKNIGKH